MEKGIVLLVVYLDSDMVEEDKDLGDLDKRLRMHGRGEAGLREDFALCSYQLH